MGLGYAISLMPDQTILPSSPRPMLSPVFFRAFTVVFLVVLIVSVAITFILPESYASTCRIKVEPVVNSGTNGVAYDPYFIQTEFEIIQSQIVLDAVIAKLNLNVEWGKKYFNGQTLKSAEALPILKGRLSLAPVRGTKLIAITVYSDDRNEAAQIANAIAESYRDYRVTAAGNSVLQSQKSALVEIVDKAEPGLAPVKPNKPLNFAIGAVAGAFLGSVAGAVSAFVSDKFGKSRAEKYRVPLTPPAALSCKLELRRDA